MAPIISFTSSLAHRHSIRGAVSGGASVSAGTRAQRARALQVTAVPWYPTKPSAPELHVVSHDTNLSAITSTLLPPSSGTMPAPVHSLEDEQLDSAALVPVLACSSIGSAPGVLVSSHSDDGAQQQEPQAITAPAEVSAVSIDAPSAAVSTSVPALTALASAPYTPSVTCTDRSVSRCNEHNSVTVKAETSVKDAAGAVVHVLDRIYTLFMTALRCDGTHEALNRAVKSLAVARKYLKDAQPNYELTFLPLNRTSGRAASNCEVDGGAAAPPDTKLFAFLVFKTVVSVKLKTADDTDLNVSRSSDVNKMANAIMSVVLDRGQAVMKAGGADALFVAMSAMINARHRLQRKHGFDLMMVPEWITEDTTRLLGRESKFLRFNILKCDLNGPLEHSVRPALFAMA